MPLYFYLNKYKQYRCFRLFFLLLTMLFLFIPSSYAMNEPLPAIIIGDDINYPPYSFLDENGEPAGFNVDLARAVGRVMDFDIEIRLDEWSATRESLESGEIDAISGMFRSPERESMYLFSSPHSVTAGDLFTRPEFQINSLEDLRGETIVVQQADIVAEYLEQQDLNLTLVEVNNVQDVLQLVAEGRYDYAALLKLPGLYNIDTYDLDLVPQGLTFTTNQYAMAVMPDNQDLLLLLNGGMEILSATGEYQEIYEQWFGVYSDPDLPGLLYRYRWIIVAVLGLLTLLIGMVVILRHLVKDKTKELVSVNTELEASMEELIAMEQELRDQLEQLRSSEARLRASEAKNQAIIDALPDILFVLDSSGHFLDCQHNKVHTLLYPPSYFINKNLEDVMPESVASKALYHIQRALKKNRLQQFDYELLVAGHRHVYEMRLMPINDDEVVGLARDITLGRHHQEQIEYLSHHDQLTGLYNRQFLEEEIQRLDTPPNFPLCVIMGDVNGLKLINDSFGHQAGDDLLKTAADIIKDCCRKDEIIARIGGDEFLILVPNMTNEEAEKLVGRIRNRCLYTEVESIELSISFGWDTKDHEDEDINEVLKNAENYMYKKKLFEQPSIRSKTIHAIMNTLHEKNPREEKHSQRVSDLCVQTARAMKFSDREINEIRTVGLLHDIGKISVDENILNKPDKLSEDEYEEIKRHPEIGSRILGAVHDMQDMSEFVLSHHERWDGKGYPQGLKGEEIPLQARIIAIADAYDAIIGERSYRPSRSPEEAAMELLAHAGTQFDPDLVETFVSNVLKMDL
ncbi:MAG: diguanylate cyclase [Tindallia sp. MSAO_Bac2]|nr:MAG: diguanylate cyclase [Tindallia sp. MSAO_Bac2]